MKHLIIFITILLTFPMNAQKELSLEECIDIALTNNIDLKRSFLQSETAELNFNQSKSGVLPAINGNYNLGINNGRNIDPYTNDYIDQKLNFSNASISLESPIFRGFEIRNSIQRDRFNLKASEAEIKEARQQLILEVTLAYFQILNNRDLLDLAKLRLETTEKQTDRLETLYQEGEGNPADYTDIKGQINSDKTSVIDAENRLEQSRLELATLLNLNETLTVKEFQLFPELKEYPLGAEEIYNQALENLATFQAKRLRIEAAEEDVDVSRALYSPQISIFGQLNTTYSSSALLFNETGSQIIETGNFITVNDTNYPVLTNQSQFSEEEIPYSDQFKNNLNSVVGVAVDIPIFNGFRAKRNVALKEIKLEESKLELEDTKAQFLQAIKLAYNDMQAAYQNYFILQEQVEAYEESYRVNDIRFNNGVSNFVEYIISKNNLDGAKINLANAKYEYLIRVKVLDYYRGIQ